MTALLRVTGRRLLLALGPLLLVLAIPGVAEMWRRPEDGLVLRHRTIMHVVDGGPGELAGLQARDRILAVDGTAVTSAGDYLHRLGRHRAGQTLQWEIQRGSTRAVVRGQLAPQPQAMRWRHILLTLVALCVLWLGFSSYLRRNDPLGRWFHISCALLAYNLIDLPTFPWPIAVRALEALRDASQLFWATAFLRFAWIFPEGVRDRPELYRNRRWVMLAPAILAPIDIASYLGGPTWLESGAALWLQVAMAIVVFGYLALALIVLTRKAMRRHRWEQWSKLRLALLGIVAGLAPPILVSLFRLFWPTQPSGLETASLLFLPLAPAGFSVALARSGAVDLAQLTRRALITSLLVLPLLIAVFVLLDLVEPGANSERISFIIILAASITLLVALSLAPLRSLAGGVVDRWIYPEQRHIRAEAQALASVLSRQRDAQSVADRLCQGLAALIASRHASLYLRENGAFRLIARFESDPARPPLPPRLSERASILERLLSEEQMLILPPLLAGPRPLRLDAESRELLANSDAEIACPLIAGGHCLAVLWLGPRLRQREYGALELFHVEQLARLAAAALDNALLHEADLARERMRTELDLARDIQGKLLPQSDLSHGEFEACGRMTTSREIGGDLFDHFLLADGRIALCVADATGKGIPASLLISSVRTAVRDVVRPGIGVAEAAAELGRKVHETTSAENFVAMFLALLDPRSGILEYAVAGIEPPLWLHSGGRIEHLSRGGALLGLRPTEHYRPGIIRLQRGDLLLAYTDGMIDQENAQEEPFGMERLRQGALSLARAGAIDVADGLMAAVANFGQGDPTDDRTLLVLHWKAAAQTGMEAAAG